MHKFRLLAAWLVVLSSSATCLAQSPSTDEVEKRFNKILRNTKVASIKESPIKNLYEVIAGPSVFYYSPEGEGHLIFGNIVDKNGKNLTADIQNQLRMQYQEEQEKKAAEMLKAAPLDKAVKIGKGPNIIIEFTDPDCPFCRRMDEFLSKRTDVTRYVFLNPIDQLHPQARAKSIYILSSKDKSKAFREVFSGKYDKGGLPIGGDMNKYVNEARRLAEGMDFGRKVGVQGTPLLFVNGKMVNGADINRITSLLNEK